MDDQRIGAGGNDAARERVERRLRVLIVNTDSAFHGDRNIHRALHRLDTSGNEARLGHQAGANRPSLTRSEGQPTFKLISS